MKTELSFQTITLPGADLGKENPLPDLKSAGDIHGDVKFAPSVPEGERAYFTYGRVNGILPYRIQDGYTRQRSPRDYECVVLENSHLRAEFFPQYGGRLRRLYDKDHQRELLHVNPVFQPANLALRNAWISGGVEWNIGMTGHTPYTLSPLHTAVLHLSDGTPVLRMYEWERIRRVSYQIDAWIPEDSHFLFLRIRLHNTTDQEVPIYWWSNMAVDETPDTRVLAPADEAFCFDYSRVISKEPVPMAEGIDRSYTTRVPRSMDLFFDIPKGRRKWEAVLDGKGEGLVQTSTDLLQGRKLFLWGNGSGGRHWQEFLAQPGCAYLETQAGLANTQMEHLPMPANAVWEWAEAYGMMQADPATVHGSDWKAAYDCVESSLEKLLSRQAVDDALALADRELDTSPEPIRMGSGWGALELRREGISAPQFPGEASIYSWESLGEDQAPWLELLEKGTFPNRSPEEEPAAYLVQKEWLPLLEKAVESGKSDHWHSWLQLGIMYASHGEKDKARSAFETSYARTPNGWAKRNLAILDLTDGKQDAAADQLLEAVKMLPILPLAIECGQNLLKAQRYDGFQEFYNQLPTEIQAHGRMEAMRAQAAIELGEFDLALSILRSAPEVGDMREGEVLLSDLWIRLHMRKLAQQEHLEENDGLKARVLREFPVPQELDFRMRT